MAHPTEEQDLTSRLTEMAYDWRCRAAAMRREAYTLSDDGQRADLRGRADGLDDCAGELESSLGLVEDICGTCGKPQSQCECE